MSKKYYFLYDYKLDPDREIILKANEVFLIKYITSGNVVVYKKKKEEEIFLSHQIFQCFAIEYNKEQYRLL